MPMLPKGMWACGHVTIPCSPFIWTTHILNLCGSNYLNPSQVLNMLVGCFFLWMDWNFDLSFSEENRLEMGEPIDLNEWSFFKID